MRGTDDDTSQLFSYLSPESRVRAGLWGGPRCAAAAFFDAVRNRAAAAGPLSDEHFTVDGTPLEAWATLKSFTRRDAGRREPPDDRGNPDVDFRGERRSHATHASTTDPVRLRTLGRRVMIITIP